MTQHSEPVQAGVAARRRSRQMPRAAQPSAADAAESPAAATSRSEFIANSTAG